MYGLSNSQDNSGVNVTIATNLLADHVAAAAAVVAAAADVAAAAAAAVAAAAILSCLLFSFLHVVVIVVGLPFFPAQLSIIGSKGTSFTGDIAIDDLGWDAISCNCVRKFSCRISRSINRTGV